MDMYKTDLFPYVEGGALVGKTVTLTMATVGTEQLPDHKGQEQTKYVLHFKETQKGLILNKTNTKEIIKLYGRETDNWTGRRLTLYSEKVKAFGEVHDAVRVRAPRAQDTAAPDEPLDGPDPLAEAAEALGAEVLDVEELEPEVEEILF